MSNLPLLGYFTPPAPPLNTPVAQLLQLEYRIKRNEQAEKAKIAKEIEATK